MQVQQHHEQLQEELAESGIAKLQASLPKLCRPVLAVALQDCGMDAERALLMLRQFQSDAFDELAVIQRKRRKAEARKSRRPLAPESASDSDSDSRRRKKRHKRDRQKDSKSSKKHKKEKRKDHKSHKKQRRRSRSVASESSGDEEHTLEFGSFGIIRESDYALKAAEFTAWAQAVHQIDVDSLPRCAAHPCRPL